MPRHPLRATLAVVATVTTALAVTLTGCSRSGRPVAEPSAPAASPTPGVTASAGPPPAGVAPSRRFAVGVRELGYRRGADRRLPVTVWYPAEGASGGSPDRNARVADGRFPVVLFSHGLTGRPSDYRTLLVRWAAAGFVVVAPTYPYTSRGATELQVLDVVNQPADASYVLTRVLALDGETGDPLRGHLAVDRVAAAGHSAGGVTTIGLFTAGRDDRLDAGIVLAGTALGVGTAFSGAAAPQLFVHGERDDVVSYRAGRAAYDRVPWPRAMLTLPDGDHVGALLGSDEPALDVVAGTTVEFLRWTLYGDARALRRLPAEATRGGLATLDNRL
ncbi:chlorophyllase [Plantactinospora sp. BC1]|uniref:alpha/beta hydrolase family protein n=1 Tax=Plantactinospora sp. BC1 TaxID=2108470 RepID=UPI000D16904F|nr:chlorophyllase [Plantactinospora sp. BC1]AVT30477.1 chlorophyllase [Plantactinospora sp. BC1]